MKKILFGLMLGVSTWASAATPNLYCHAHHTSLLNVSPGLHLVMEDLVARIKGSDVLNQHLIQRDQPGELYSDLTELRIDIPMQDLQLQQTMPFLFDGQGSSSKAVLHTHRQWAAWMDEPAVIKNFAVRTSLTSAKEGIVLGDKPVSVTLDHMQVIATMDLILDGKTFHLEWTPLFDTNACLLR